MRDERGHELLLCVEGMSREEGRARMCGRHAVSVLSAVPGVEHVEMDYVMRRARVRFGFGLNQAALLHELVTAMRYSAPSPCNKSLTVMPWGGHSVELRVEGMMCLNGCGDAVQRALLATEQGAPHGSSAK